MTLKERKSFRGGANRASLPELFAVEFMPFTVLVWEPEVLFLTSVCHFHFYGIMTVNP